MPSASRKGDTGGGHGCFPPSNAIEGSPDVSINGQPALRVGDALAAHGCGDCSTHGRTVAAGSASVSINGKPAARIGDGIDCGGVMISGSGNVNIGDLSWDGQASLPVKAKMRLHISNAPGAADRPYPDEPYKLYKDGALVQQGNTDENGAVEYEYTPPWTSELKVETLFGEYTFIPEAKSSADTDKGQQQRLGLLGYRDDYSGQTPIEDSLGSAAKRALLGDSGSDSGNAGSTADDADFIQSIRALIP